MTIRRKLDKIERTSPIGTDDDAARLLVAVVARRDARFWPWRDASTAVAVVQSRRRYLDGTEGIAARADGRADWKPTHEARRRLAADGLVSLRLANGQVQSMFVTELGDAAARAIIGDMPGPTDAIPLLARLLTADGHRDFGGRRWLSESLLFDRECLGDVCDWDDDTAAMLPLLVRGLADTRCDTWGRAYYSTAFNPTVDPEPDPIEVNVEANPDAWNDLYIPAFNAERDSLRTAEPHDASECVVPLPATM